MSLGILVALPEELRSLSKTKMHQGECLTLPNNILISLAGTGAKNAQKATQTLIDAGAKQVISWGCAGALASHLKAGDLIIPEIIQAQPNKKLRTHPLLRKKLLNALANQPYFEGVLLESSSIVSSVKEKSTLFNEHAAIAVDMESAAAAQVCQTENIPFIAIRTIVDPADFNLPSAINHSINAEGKINLVKLLLFIICHPNELPSLIQLGRHFKMANKKLKQISPLLAQVSTL